MLSYQHAYHAGNRADLHKHSVLAALLLLLTQKDRGITVMETHAGRGLYDLRSDEAMKTGEAGEGIDAITLDPSTPFGSTQLWVKSVHGATAYAGSPLITAHALRPQDRLVLMEKHPQELAALKRTMRGTGAEVHARDGYEGVLGLSPPHPRRGLVLIDPSYELKTEYEQVAAFIPALARKWPEAAILAWYPVLSAARHEPMISRLKPLSPAIQETEFLPPPARGMTGSGLVLIGAPYGSERIIRDAVARHPMLRLRG